MYINVFTGKATREYSAEKKLAKYINSLSKVERLLLVPFYMRDTYGESDGFSLWIEDMDEDISKKDIQKYLKKFK